MWAHTAINKFWCVLFSSEFVLDDEAAAGSSLSDRLQHEARGSVWLRNHQWKGQCTDSTRLLTLYRNICLLYCDWSVLFPVDPWFIRFTPWDHMAWFQADLSAQWREPEVPCWWRHCCPERLLPGKWVQGRFRRMYRSNTTSSQLWPLGTASAEMFGNRNIFVRKILFVKIYKFKVYCELDKVLIIIMTATS